MNTTARLGSVVFAVVVALGMVLVFGGPSQADPRSHDFGSRRHDGAVRRDGPFTVPQVDSRHFDGRHHHFPHPGFVRFGLFPYYAYAPSYGYSAPIYWYCPVYRAYYPTVASCPVDWVAVPAY